MTHVAEVPADPAELPPSHKDRVELHFSKHYPDIMLSEPGLTVAGDNLDFVERTYGNPELATFLTYHNEHHSIGVYKRGAWTRNLARTKLRRTIVSRGFEIGAIMDTGHDLIQSTFREGKDTLELDFGTYAIHIDNDPTKSNEQLSAEAIVAMMRHQNDLLGTKHFSIEEQAWAYRGIRATEYGRVGNELSLSEIAKTAKDPVITALIVADTSSIFFGGEDAMARDVGEYSIEELGDDIHDSTRVVEAVSNMLAFQTKFLLARAAEYAGLLRQLGEDEQGHRQLLATIENDFASRYNHAIATAEYANRNVARFKMLLTEKLAETADLALAPYKKVGLAVTKAYASLTSSE